MKLSRRATSPLSFEYRLELDQTPELDVKDVQYTANDPAKLVYV